MFKRRGSRSFSQGMPLPAPPVAGSPSTMATNTPTPSASLKKEEKDKYMQVLQQKGATEDSDKGDLKEKLDEEQTAPRVAAVDAKDREEAFTAGKANEHEDDAGAGNSSKDCSNSSNRNILWPASHSKPKSPRDSHKAVAGVVICLALATLATSSYLFSRPPLASRTSPRTSPSYPPPAPIPRPLIIEKSGSSSYPLPRLQSKTKPHNPPPTSCSTPLRAPLSSSTARPSTRLSRMPVPTSLTTWPMPSIGSSTPPSSGGLLAPPPLPPFLLQSPSPSLVLLPSLLPAPPAGSLQRYTGDRKPFSLALWGWQAPPLPAMLRQVEPPRQQDMP